MLRSCSIIDGENGIEINNKRGVNDLGKGLVSAITALFLPTYILIYNYSGNVYSLLAIQVVGIFYVFAFFSSSAGGTSTDGTGLRIFDPNWYLDLEKYLTDQLPYNADDTSFAEYIADDGIFALYGNYKDVIDNPGTEIALGIGGMLMAAFVVLLIGGIIVNIIGQQKMSGILFILAGVAALGALLLTWMTVNGLDDAFRLVIYPGDKFIPIPVGALTALFGGIRAIRAESDTY